MDPLPAQPDSDVDHDVQMDWLALITAGAYVPVDPNDLTLRHLARASAGGIDVRGLLNARRRSPQAA